MLFFSDFKEYNTNINKNGLISKQEAYTMKLEKKKLIVKREYKEV